MQGEKEKGWPSLYYNQGPVRIYRRTYIYHIYLSQIYCFFIPKIWHCII
jgi:hypothetical protein